MSQATESSAGHSTAHPLRLLATAAELRQALAAWRQAGRRIGLVPTMGALHAGHLSLVDAARNECDAMVATIFVNPTQFGPGEDYQRYPRTLEADLARLAQHGAQLVFAPAVEEMYRPGHATQIDVGPVAARWEGACRPGHFPGVATIVLKLFNLVGASVAYFGRKDYQQTCVIRRMVADLDLPIEIRVCPTVREPDGLALSSRNAYLSADERRRAVVLSASLRRGAELAAAGQRDATELLRAMQAVLASEPRVTVDYLAVVDPESLEPLARLEGPAVALVAARIGTTRLIDNWSLEPPAA